MNKKQVEEQYNLKSDIRPGDTRRDVDNKCISFHNGVYEQYLSTRYIKKSEIRSGG